MRKIPFSLAALLVSSLLSSSSAQQPKTTTAPGAPPTSVISGPSFPTLQPASPRYVFPNGQTLHYTAEWRLFSAGTATLRMDAAGSEQRVTGTADSTGVTAVLYRVQDRFESFFDRRTMCSSRITKHSEEGLHRRETQIVFDQNRKKAVLDERNLRNNETKHTEEDTPGCVTDVLSGIYYMASLPLEVGATYLFPVNDGGKTFKIRAYVEGREEIKTDAGTFKTVRVQPSAEGGELKSRGKVWIWYTDDAAHTPVQMRGKLFWGTLTFKLAKVERQP